MPVRVSLDRLFGSTCVLCGVRREIHQGLCRDCPGDLPRVIRAGEWSCRCGLPRRGGRPGSLCSCCVEDPPPWRSLRAPLLYAWPLDRLIAGYKYRDQTWLERPLLRIWLAHFQPAVHPDVLVPIPLHWRRRLWRGFNQASRLANGLGRAWSLPVAEALARVAATPRQQGLTAERRQENMRQAFVCRQTLAGRHVVLVDDVVTTGSTAREAALCIQRAGAASVRIWALARALPPQRRQP